MKLSNAMTASLNQALADARTAREAGEFEAAWHALMRAHVISQPALGPHLGVHSQMLSLALEQGDAKEVAGQLLRLVLAPLGHVLGRTPWGNPGRSTVSKFARKALPDDIARLYAQAGIKVN